MAVSAEQVRLLSCASCGRKHIPKQLYIENESSGFDLVSLNMCPICSLQLMEHCEREYGKEPWFDTPDRAEKMAAARKEAEAYWQSLKEASSHAEN